MSDLQIHSMEAVTNEHLYVRGSKNDGVTFELIIVTQNSNITGHFAAYSQAKLN